ncbi:MAG TPA: peptidoglycan-binding protein [Leptolyngbyaceae cyanobacterium M65_K2018_010]|nr:peptidoglycan-binding protein [Leptolyngbyaceae cyanobacterium M65_K2018_010]
MATLKKGDSGESVRSLQNHLIAFGFLRGEADGVFGDQTEAAVMELQKASGLVADGIVGPQTWDAMGQGF